MKKSSRYILLIALLWIFSLVMVLSPLTTGIRSTINEPSNAPLYVYSSPKQEEILTVGFKKATLYNLELEKLGEFLESSFDARIDQRAPVWSQDNKYVILESDQNVYYLSSTDLSVKYTLSKYYDLGLTKYDELGLTNIDIRFQGSYVDDEYNLHYFRNGSIVQLNPETGIINENYQLSSNNLTLQWVKFHQEGRFVAMVYQDNDENYPLIVLDLLLNKYTNITKDLRGGYYFAPSKPYLAFETSTGIREDNLTIFDMETETYGTPIITESSYGLDLAWSYNSDKILRINANGDHRDGTYKRQYADTVITYDVLTGEIKFNFEFNRGLIYESNARSYTWLSKNDQLVILDHGDTSNPQLIIQDIGSQGMTVYIVSGYAIVLFGLLSSLLLLSLYISNKERLYYFLKSIVVRRNEHIEFEPTLYGKYTVHGLIFIGLYYIVSSILNINMNVHGEYSLQVPIRMIDILWYSFLSFIDITIILVLILLNFKNGEPHLGLLNTTVISGAVLIVLTLLARIIQGYSFGLIDANRATYVVWFIPFLFVVFIYWIMTILYTPKHRSIKYHDSSLRYLSFIYLIYCFSLFTSIQF